MSDIDPQYGGTEYRLGSTLNRHSKLYVVLEDERDVVDFFFYPNHQRREDEVSGSDAYQRAQAIKLAFSRRTTQLFLALGIAEPVE